MEIVSADGMRTKRENFIQSMTSLINKSIMIEITSDKNADKITSLFKETAFKLRVLVRLISKGFV